MVSELFLSRIRIPRIQQIRMRLMDEYDIHQLVYSLFPCEDERRFLYFLDYGGLGDLSILIQSEEEPEVTSHLRVETKTVPEGFFDKSSYAFKLRFSPVVKKEGKAIKILQSRMDVVDWLVSREEGYGIRFDAESVEKASSGKMRMKGHDDKRITLSYVDLVGTFDVVDHKKFVHTVRSGVGPGKGFGLGMLQLMPIEKEEN